MDIYYKYKDKYKTLNGSCFEPCSYISIRLIKALAFEWNVESSILMLNFNERIQETISYYSYDDISFLAEIGGYVGLFLGVSVYQCADMIEAFLEKVKILMK